MTGKDRIILQKISTYIDDVAHYVDGFSFEDFMADEKTLSACAFSVSQIGELAKEISEDTQEKHDYIPWKSIRGMRNKIVHCTNPILERIGFYYKSIHIFIKLLNIPNI